MLNPFCVDLPKWHPKRVALKAYTLCLDKVASLFYRYAKLPDKSISGLPNLNRNTQAPMSVTPLQAAYLLKAIEITESLGGVVVELGSFQGVTTAEFAANTRRWVIAVDPYYPGWRPAMDALDEFKKNTDSLGNVKLERKSSGEAASGWAHGEVSFLFIDSQHDFANTLFDFQKWLPLTCEGALIAFHDVDNDACPGTRVAAWLAARRLSVWAHVDNLLILENAQ